MDSLAEYFLDIPMPCAALAIYEESQARIQEYVTIAGRVNTNSDRDRLHIEVTDGAKASDPATSNEKQWDPKLPSGGDWLLLQRYLPCCVLCVRNWQHYILDDIPTSTTSTSSAKAPGNEENDVHENKSDADAHEADVSAAKTQQAPKEITGSMKYLTELIKEDVEKCLVCYRKNLLDRKPVPGKIMFLILLREGTKNPHKAVSGLKLLNPAEVAAICVTSGSDDISSKVLKLEQLVYDVCESYYDKRITTLTKTINKASGNLSVATNESAIIQLSILNFKLGYFCQFLGRFKESSQALSQAWRLLTPLATLSPKDEYITFGLYIALEVIKVRFAVSNLVDALTFAFETTTFFRKALKEEKGQFLYHNVLYTLQHAVAIHLDRAAEFKELKANSQLRQHAVNFYKWTIMHALQLRSLLLRSNEEYKAPRRFANILLKDDEDFHSYYDEDALSECSEPKNISKKLEILTERLLVQLLDLLSTFSSYNTLFQVTEMLGDSLLLSGKPVEAFFVYSNLGDCLINSTTIDMEHILKGCSSVVIVEEYRKRIAPRTPSRVELSREEHALKLIPSYIKSATTLILAEKKHQKCWWVLYRRVLSKMLVSLAFILKKPDALPVSIKETSCLPIDVLESMQLGRFSNDETNRVLDDGLLNETHAREYTLIMVKALMTLRSVTADDFDWDSVVVQWLSSLPSLNSVNTAVLLNKSHRAQYMLGREKIDRNSIATKLQILINFHVDLPFAIEVSCVTICTTIGTFNFEIAGVVTKEKHVEIYTHCGNDYSGYHMGKLTKDIKKPLSKALKKSPRILSLDGNSNVFLAITCPPINNEFMLKNFSLLGIKLLWKKQLRDGMSVNIACLLPSLTQYARLGISSAEEALFKSDSINEDYGMQEDLFKLGESTSILHAEEMTKMMTAHLTDKSALMVDAIVELINTPEHAVDTDGKMRWGLLGSRSYEQVTFKMFVNRVYFKAFIGTMVEGHLAPVTCVLLYNKQLLTSENLNNIKFSVEVTSSASSFLFYSLCKDDEHDKGKMVQCVNNKFSFTLMNFVELGDFDFEIAMESNVDSDLDTVVPALFADDDGISRSINSEMGVFLDIARKDSNLGIAYIHGLMNILSHGLTTVQFNLQMQPMHGRTLKAMESSFLVVNDVISTWVHPPVQFHLDLDTQYDNESVEFLRFFIIRLVNNTDVKYEVEYLKVLHDDKVIAYNEQLMGFCKQVVDNQSIQCMLLLPSSATPNSSVEMQCSHYVIHPNAFPFDKLQHCFHSVATKTSTISDQQATEIAIHMKHQGTVELGKPFELIAEIKNLTTHTLDCCVTLPNTGDDKAPFMVAGPRLYELTFFPQEVSTIKWMLMANKCGHYTLPSVKLTQRRKALLKKEHFESFPSKVHASPKNLMEVRN